MLLFRTWPFKAADDGGQATTESGSYICRYWTRLMVRMVVCGTLLACSSAVEPDNVGACEQISEFGSSGCLDIKGRVVGLNDQPLHGIDVVPRYPPGLLNFANNRATTDATGAFTLRVWRMSSQLPTVGSDTLSLWVLGVDTRAVEQGIAPRVLDSVLVHAAISPIGTIPTPTTVTLTILAP